MYDKTQILAIFRGNNQIQINAHQQDEVVACNYD